MRAFDLVGVDGNAFSVMAYVRHAMRKAKFSQQKQDEYLRNCKSGDYDNLLRISFDMVEKCNERLGLTQDDDEE